MFERFLKWKRPPLTGAPAMRRIKYYSAQSGYVYQYFYSGHRSQGQGDSRRDEFVFEVSSGRKEYSTVAVFVADEATEGWERRHDRKLTATERYAIAKISLFQAFDDTSTPADMIREIHIRPADVEAILDQLGLS